MKDFKQYLMDDGYFRQEELIFADCDRNQRARVSTFLSKAAAFAGYDYDARGLDHEKLYAMREVFLLSRCLLYTSIGRCLPGPRPPRRAPGRRGPVWTFCGC